MECLKTSVGLMGKCADNATGASVLLNSEITYNELTKYVDQNDFADVDEMFVTKRSEAVSLFLLEFQNEMQPRYIAQTVISQGRIGNYSSGLTSSPASAIAKGVSFERCTNFPALGYSISMLSFIGAYTGVVTVNYNDGLTGQLLATDTINAVSGQEVNLSVNRVFNVQKLIVTYDATGIGAYVTKADYLGGCMSCSKHRVNKHVTARGITTANGTPLIKTNVSDLGGLMIDVAMVCDNTSWLCGIKNYLATPIMYKTANLLMKYALTSSGVENTNTMRDKGELDGRREFYEAEYQRHLKLALKRIQVPNDPICFNCKKTNDIYVSIP